MKNRCGDEARTSLQMVDLHYTDLLVKSVPALWAVTRSSVPDNNEIHPTSKFGFTEN
jgi:hypothetical protein